jgi:hypothetical protein
MSTDLDLEALRRDWQADDSVPPTLRREVERQSRLMKIGIAGDISVTVVIGGGTIAWALLSAEKSVWWVALAAWVFLAIAWSFVLIVNRGLWAPSAMDAAAFMDLSIRRCEASLAATWFAAVLFVAEIIFGLTWAYTYADLHESIGKWLWFSSVRIDIVWLATLAFVVGLFWFRNKKKGQLARLLSLRRGMWEADGELPGSRKFPPVALK